MKNLQSEAQTRVMNRREFIKRVGELTLAVGVGASLNGCATTGSLKEEGPIIYPKLAGHKIQPPENGCMIGVYRKFGIDPKWVISHFEEKTGRKPAMLAFCCGNPLSEFPMESAILTAEQGVIPNIMPDYVLCTLDELAKGTCDRQFEYVAREAVKFGQQHGGFFYSPMREIQLSFWPWGNQPSAAKKAWKHVWQIFENKGANEYATWVWGIKNSHPPSDHPEPYYPGDKYVDWIGVSAYSRTKNYTGSMSYNELTRDTYYEMHNNHPGKPIMQSELGTTKGSGQDIWIRQAFKTIESRPGMKAALYWDWPDISVNDDLSLSDKSYEVIKEIFKDPYFIGAK